MRTIDELKAENERLHAGFLRVSYMESESVYIEKIYGYSLDDVMSALDDIQAVIEDATPEFPQNALSAVYELKNLRYQDAQIGNYPPPNVELPGYWEFDYEFIEWEYLPF